MKDFGDIYKSKKKENKKTNPSQEKIINQAIEFHLKGNIQEARKYYQHLINHGCNDHRVFLNYGAILHSQGKRKEAIEFYKRAVSLRPDNVDAYTNMALAYQEQGSLDEAIKSYKKVILINPKYIEAYNNIGAAYQEKREMKEAIEFYKKVLSINPEYAEAYNNIAVSYTDQGNLEEAIEACEKALLLKPDYADAYYNLGNIFLAEHGKLKDAIEAYKKALSLKPDYADAYNNMGYALKDQGKLKEAIEAYEKALSIKPDYADAYINMGIAYSDQDKLKDAIAFYEKALVFEADCAAARGQKLHQQSHICDWTAVDADSSYFAELGVIYKDVSPFSMLSIEDAPDRHRLRSELYARERILQKPLPAIVKPSKVRKRLRIGYFSTDFKEHPVAYLIAKVLEQHNRDAFEVFGYCLHSNKESPLRRRLINSFDYFFEAKGISDKDVALKAREDGIDIAIDLNGYTQDARPGIFAYRAAPIQINYLGYPGTLGAEFMDYIVADKYLIPPDSEKHFNEKKIYLPNTYMPTDDGREISSKEISRSEMGLPEDAFVFCCFNNNYKITSSEFDIWMRLLKKIDKSVLWLRQSNQFSHINIRNEAERRNVDPSRIVFAKRAPMDEHLARQKLADLFIDTFAFNAHTTTTEALWAGLPVITKAGKGFAARVAGSLLNAIGLPELITETEQDYEALALEIATHPDHLKQIKAKLNTNRLSKPLFDTKQYTYHLETAYKMAYNDYLNQQKVENIFVPS